MIAICKGNTTNERVADSDASKFILAYNGIQMHLQYTFGSISLQTFTPPLWEVALLGGLGLGALDHESQQYHNLPGQYLFDAINFLLKGGLPLFLLRKLLYPAVIT
jgi:hypothetical protein